ncbi:MULTISPECIES: class I SAM-dependent methyltransferase [Rhodopseudomonas]|uniref:SAM-dependent methlyltransferase n=1 Tax=Rhodopseudomonas palustris TaxID=1076 RepID=A0A0D7F4L9_RHOPL|nr:MULTISPECIES: class I SAM-dependent methyltransferase [Rhodopseudomonas]KIZ48038.1 SAM-dependent methlyltransferase [Rhodopseudomonas palustris]MDF3810267.1 class I SAM-dependent methyltransferase [Rhodopseudomonas sp. BAL398]WOK16050.1 class I SAM-dependent methyltransferase [Rhodopseudomonas sp. BAL398]
MSRKTDTIQPDYFEDKYQSDIDPWQFRTSAYEREKYATTIGALGQKRYAKALEIGCSIGVLTGLLAKRCDAVVAIDASPTAIAAARQAGIENASFLTGTVPQDFPAGRFDLIVLSEVLYYFAAPDLARLASLCMTALQPGGEIILCHWLGETDYPLTGQAASDLFAQAVNVRLPARALLRDEVYRLERFSQTPPAAAGAGE